jgi:hypothetical protein
MIGPDEAGAGTTIGVHEGLDAVHRLGGDAAAVAQAISELAVIDGAASERRFRQPGLAAVIGNPRQQLLRRHVSRVLGLGSSR